MDCETLGGIESDLVVKLETKILGATLNSQISIKRLEGAATSTSSVL